MTSSIQNPNPNPHFIGKHWAGAIALIAALGFVSLFSIDTTGYTLEQWVFYGSLFPFMGLTGSVMGYIALDTHNKEKP